MALNLGRAASTQKLVVASVPDCCVGRSMPEFTPQIQDTSKLETIRALSCLSSFYSPWPNTERYLASAAAAANYSNQGGTGDSETDQIINNKGNQELSIGLSGIISI